MLIQFDLQHTFFTNVVKTILLGNLPSNPLDCLRCVLRDFSKSLGQGLAQATLLLFGFDIFEIANGVVDTCYKGKCVGILGENAVEIGNLVLVDDAHKHLQIGVRVHTSCIYFRYRVMQIVDDFVGDFLSVFCDNFELDSRFVRLEHFVAYHYRHEAIQNAQDYRVHGKVVNKVA